MNSEAQTQNPQLPEAVWLVRHAETAAPTLFHGAESDIELGAHGHRQAAAAVEWFAALQAPIKRLLPFENAAHSVAFEQFEQFGVLMRDTVLPETHARP